MFTGYDEAKRDYDKSSWDYELGSDGYVVADDTLQTSALRLEPAQAACRRSTRPNWSSASAARPREKFLKVAQMIGECSSQIKTMTSMYALGWTQHSTGSQNIRAMAMLQLVLGNIGVRGGGMNALRGHSNIQGLTDLGLMSNLIPGYLTIPMEARADIRQLYGDARLQAVAAEPDELLAELQEVLRELPEGDVG